MTNNTSPYTIVANPHALAGRGGRLRKRGGQVVSFAPQMLDLCSGASRVALGGLLVLSGMMVATPNAMAGGCTADSASICSGPAASDGTDTPVIISDPGNVSITTLPGFGLDTSATADDGITLDGNNASFIDDHASSITAQETALNISNGAGSAIITSTGSLTGGVGGTGSGLVVNNAAGAEDVLINVNDVQGQGVGISVTNDGAGITSINAAGAVTSDTNAAIAVLAAASTGDLSITTNGAVSGANGIVTTHVGDGALSINSSESITGTSGYGIVGTADNASSIDINTTDVSADDTAIAFNNYGDGDLSITSTGTLTSASGDGVNVISSGDGNTAIDTVDVNALDGTAIAVDQNAGNVDISSTGTLNALTGVNVETGTASDSVTIDVNDVQATYEGILVDHEGTGDVLITASGDITSSDDTAIAVTAAASTGDVNITTSGAVSGATGILAYHTGDGQLAINSSQTITGTSGAGIVVQASSADGIEINTADVSAYNLGIGVSNGGDGDTSITSTGTITAASGDGVNVLSTGTGNTAIDTVDVNALAGTAIAVDQNAGNVDISSTGTLDGEAGVAVVTDTASDNVTIDVNNVQATYAGINVSHEGTGDVLITASGDITSSDSIAIAVGAEASSGDVTITTNGAVSGATGILAEHDGDGTLTISNSESVTAAAGPAIVALANNTGGIDINMVDVSSESLGIFARNDGDGNVSITSTGTVSSESLFGISVFSNGSGSTTIATADVSAADGAAIFVDQYAGNVDISSTGTLSGVAGVGVTTGAASDSVTIAVNNVQATSYAAIFVNHDGTGGVDITASGDVTSTDFGAIVVTAGPSSGDVTITTNGAVSGAAGIYANHSGDGTLAISNSESVTATAGYGIAAIANGDGGIDISAVDVSADATAIAAVNHGDGDITISSTGTVTSDNHAGVQVYSTGAGSTTIDTVDVNGANYAAIFVDQYAGNVDISSTGTLDGAAGLVVQTGAASDSVTIAVNDVQATSYAGISVEHEGTGGVDITASGDIVAENYADGISVEVSSNSTGPISIAANNVTAEGAGISVDSFGSGDILVDATGLIQSSYDDGIRVTQYGDGDVSVTSTGDIAADNEGILVEQYGDGDVTVTSTGEIVADSDGIHIELDGAGDVLINATGDIVAGADGIDVDISSDSTGNVTINAATITADDHGIELDSYGSGNIDIMAQDITAAGDGMNLDHGGAGTLNATSTGTITADDDGISVFADTGSGDVIITANDIIASDEGITIGSFGDGAISVTAANISGDYNGINIFQGGSGSVSVDVSGTITSTGYVYEYGGNTYTYGGNGVDIWSEADVDLQVNDVEAYADGVNVSVFNGATAEITSTGTITAGETGILAETDGGDLTITANNITAGYNGIEIYNYYGDAAVDISVSGTVEGDNAAIAVASYVGNAVTSIENDGILRNSDQLSTSNAILISGSPTDITNNGSIIGNIVTDSADDLFVNNGTWNNADGTSNFGGGDDLLTNSAAGTILAANDSAVAETTTIIGLANLTNNGLITLADGAAGDEFNTDGDATFGATSTLSVDISGAGLSDVFVAGGDVVLDGGALDVELVGALPTIGTEFTVLQGASVTGEFDFEDQYYTAFLGLSDSYTADSVVLSFTQLRGLADAGLTPNQISTANGLDSLPLTNGLLASVLYLNTDAEAQSAFDQLSGDIHPGVRTALAEDSRLPRNAVLERLSNPEGGAVWGQLFWNTGDSDGNRNTAPIKRETWGFIAGADAALGENAIIGVSGAYLTNDLDQRQRTSDGKLETIHVLGYVGAQAGHFRVKAGVGYAWGNIETTRNVSFTGFSDKLTADYDATLFQAFAEAGVQLPIGGGHIEPIAQVAFLRAKTDGFTETGGLAALTAQSEVEKSTISTIGARFSTSQSGNFSVGGLIGWQHSFGSLNPQTRFNFAGGDSFSIAGVPQSRNAGVANVEARFQLSAGSSIGLGYDGVLGTASQDHAAKLSFRLAF